MQCEFLYLQRVAGKRDEWRDIRPRYVPAVSIGNPYVTEASNPTAWVHISIGRKIQNSFQPFPDATSTQVHTDSFLTEMIWHRKWSQFWQGAKKHWPRQCNKFQSSFLNTNALIIVD